MKLQRLFLAVLFFALVWHPLAWSDELPSLRPDEAMVQGKIMVLGSRDPLAAALVTVPGSDRFVESDDQGCYALKLEPGKVRLRFKAVGHAPLEKTVQLAPGQTMELHAFLDKTDFMSSEVVVRSKKNNPQPVTTTLTREEIKKIPGTAGDAVRAVQNLPGIAVSDDFSGHLVVQGGGPWDNLFLIDNLPWPFPFHFGGAFSTVHSGLLAAVDLHTAGFGSRWGSVMGAVLEAKSRSGQKDRLRTSLDVNMITSQALLEGPLGIGDAVFTLSGRRSYFDLFFGKVFEGTFTAFPYFWDLGGNLVFSLNSRNSLRFLVLASDDRVRYAVPEDQVRDQSLAGEFKLQNQGVTSGMQWTNTELPGVTSRLTPYYYQTLMSESLGAGMDANDRKNVFGLKEELEWNAGQFLAARHELTLGAELAWCHQRARVLGFRNSENGDYSDPASTTIATWNLRRSAYIQDRAIFSPTWALTAGVHYDKTEELAQDALLPRVSLEWQVDPRTWWRAAWGLYAQFPQALETNPDFGNPSLSPNRAEHAVLSMEKKFSDHLSGRITGYHKCFTDLVVKDPVDQTLSNDGEGRAWGGEIMLRGNLGERFFGWVSYAYSASERLNPVDRTWSAYQYDQPHILNLVANYHPTPAWSVGVKFHYNSGPLVKRLLGRYQDSQGTWRPIFTNQYDQRLDDYLRLDLRTEYSWRFEGWRLNIFAEIMNVLNRSNPAGVAYSQDYSETRVLNNLPRIPYGGVEVQF